MNKFFTTLLILLHVALFSNAQWITLLNENCDAVTLPALPDDFISSQPDTSGFYTEASNASTGYTNASGVNNMVIKNINAVAGDVYLNFPVISTLNFDTVTVIWGSRVSNNFTTSGSAINGLEFSTDNGANWSSISYAENASNSTWALVNAGISIKLPSQALNQPNVKLRLKVTIVTAASGTYRLDDITIAGHTINPNGGIDEVSNTTDFNINIYPNPVVDYLNINASENYNLRIFNNSGLMLYGGTTNQNKVIDFTNYPAGFYLIEIRNLKTGVAKMLKVMK
jgi:hypothetical protein